MLPPMPRRAAHQPSSVAGPLRLQGGVHFSSDGIFSAHLSGQITSTHALTLDASSESHGEVRAKSLTVQGLCLARIQCAGAVKLESGSRVEGHIHAASLTLEEGADFQGDLLIEPEARQSSGEPRWRSS